MYGESAAGPSVVGYSDSLYDRSFGVTGYSAHYAGVYGSSDVAIGVLGQSTSNNGVVGQSDTGIGIIGQSRTNYAGVFHGSVLVDATLYTKSLSYTSDREQKQGFDTVDSNDVLRRVEDLPIGSWTYATQPAVRHVGPMAQDFHAAFGLGVDERHIDVVDGVGISLAAIKALGRQVKERDARIDALEAQLAALRQAVEARLAALEPLTASVTSTAAHP